ncbi:ABC transporter substrate-binding protein [Mycetocola reblochoni]|uniref:Extracellular solute-binding protein, family 5 n=2 Tax=Mycetocola reblochoni TaxID=331618 RepID=A0A1R4IVP6_9MICO|nr:ABC transporter substrate-binding protein [Mycetocola reblochoni]RLP70997.1 ABC transporter substrate-binding protein [Mycetocola reblochoni]SJN23788.1 extracellular solute-binding protein, family 5 [Mycetocola reblochoni REB411]
MTHRRRLVAASSVTLAALLLAGCSGGASEQDGADGDPSGGTLRVASVGDVDALDPLIAYSTEAWQVIRATTRQLVTYAGSTEGIGEDTEIVPDLAESWDVSDDGLDYTFHLREGVHFSGATDREIVAADFVYAIKRFPDPNANVSAITYYNSLFEGFTDYADQFAEVPIGDLDAVDEFIDTHDISGVTAVDDHTLRISLTRPSAELLDVLTLNFVSPLPQEVVSKYFADSLEFRQDYASSGPYYIDSYTPDQKLVLTRVEGYDTEAVGDPRGAHVDAIEIDTTSDSADAVAQKIQTGEADTGLYVRTYPAAVLQDFERTKPEQLHTSASGSAIFLSWNNSGEATTSGQEFLSSLEGRQAFNYTLDRAGLQQGIGGEKAAIVSTEILTSTILGYNGENPYPTDGDAGDVARATELLDASGAEDVSLALAYRTNAEYEKIATAIQASAAEAGITVSLVPVEDSFGAINAFLSDPVKDDQWDLALTTWSPDWQGNSASMTLGGWLDSDVAPGGTWNGVTYDNPELNALAAEALAAEDPAEAWSEANRLASEDLAWFPLLERIKSVPSSDAVTNWVWTSLGNGPDLSSLAVRG